MTAWRGNRIESRLLNLKEVCQGKKVFWVHATRKKHFQPSSLHRQSHTAQDFCQRKPPFQETFLFHQVMGWGVGGAFSRRKVSSQKVSFVAGKVTRHLDSTQEPIGAPQNPARLLDLANFLLQLNPKLQSLKKRFISQEGGDHFTLCS